MRVGTKGGGKLLKRDMTRLAISPWILVTSIGKTLYQEWKAGVDPLVGPQGSLKWDRVQN